jgi:hypothetical protein
VRYDEATFRATHNSYEGGARGSVPRQLDRGVRFLELDVHAGDFEEHGYRIGHAGPGNAVARGLDGNPRSDRLADWLRLIAGWSAANADHAPITIALDCKSDLSDARSFAGGNLAALNALLETTLGDRLVRADALGDGPWPQLDDLRGHVVTVLSGDGDTRVAYLRDGGRMPAVALDTAGNVVEVHASRRGELWYWTGVHTGDAVTWRRHGSFGFGTRPAVRLDGEGKVLVVHEEDGRRWARTGRLDGAGEIAWERGTKQAPRDAPAPAARAEAGGRTVVVATAPDGGFDPETLLYGTGVRADRRIRYEQLAFVEAQQAPLKLGPLREPPQLLGGDQRFCAAPAGDRYARAWAEACRARGRIVRLWQVRSFDDAGDIPVSFPATDDPAAPWYERYCEKVGAVTR